MRHRENIGNPGELSASTGLDLDPPFSLYGAPAKAVSSYFKVSYVLCVSTVPRRHVTNLHPPAAAHFVTLLAGCVEQPVRCLMRLLQRYIFYELLRSFASLLSILTILLVFVGVFRAVSQSGLGPYEIAQILPYLVPSLLPFTIPATLLLTVCIVYGRMSGDQEITAAKAAGINVISLLWPSFMLGVAMSVCAFVLTDRAIPWAESNIRQQVTLLFEDIFLNKLRSEHHFSDRKLGIEINVLDVQGKTLIMPTFQYAPSGRDAVTLQAEYATIEFDLEAQQANIALVHGRINVPGEKTIAFDREYRSFSLRDEKEAPKPRHLRIKDIDQTLKTLKHDLEVSRQHRDVETACALVLGDFAQLSRNDALQYELHSKQHRTALAKLTTEVHSRFALSSSCLLFTLLGGPFAIVRGQRQFLTTFFVCFMPILLLYYPLTLGMMNLSKTGTVHPAWAMWVSNALLGVVAVFVLRRVLKH